MFTSDPLSHRGLVWMSSGGILSGRGNPPAGRAGMGVGVLDTEGHGAKPLTPTDQRHLRRVWPGVVHTATTMYFMWLWLLLVGPTHPQQGQPLCPSALGRLRPTAGAVPGREDTRRGQRGSGTSGQAKNGADGALWGGGKPTAADVLAPERDTACVCGWVPLFFFVAAVPLAAVFLF